MNHQQLPGNQQGRNQGESLVLRGFQGPVDGGPQRAQARMWAGRGPLTPREAAGSWDLDGLVRTAHFPDSRHNLMTSPQVLGSSPDLNS